VCSVRFADNLLRAKVIFRWFFKTIVKTSRNARNCEKYFLQRLLISTYLDANEKTIKQRTAAELSIAAVTRLTSAFVAAW